MLIPKSFLGLGQRKPDSAAHIETDDVAQSATGEQMLVGPIQKIVALRPTRPEEIDFPPSGLRGCTTPDGFIMLFDREMQPIEIANQFLFDRHYLPGRAGLWKNTQAAYADDLARWWNYMIANHLLPWDSIGRPDIESYSEWLQIGTFSPKTQQNYARATVRRWVGTVLDFYRWAKPGEFAPATAQTRSARLYMKKRYDKSAGVPLRHREKMMPNSPSQGERIHPLRRFQLIAVMRQLGQDPYGEQDNSLFYRDRLAAECAVHTGMRVSEVCSLTIDQVRHARSTVARGKEFDLAKVHLEQTKGGYERDVFLTKRLLDALETYIDNERERVMIDARNRGKFAKGRGSETRALFVNGRGSSLRDLGERMRADTLTRRFTKAVVDAGLMRAEVRFKLEDGQRVSNSDGHYEQVVHQVPAHSFHDLRHTFAVMYYKAVTDMGRPEPWKKLQVILGHRNWQTSVDTYARHVDEVEAYISDMHYRYVKRLAKNHGVPR